MNDMIGLIALLNPALNPVYSPPGCSITPLPVDNQIVIDPLNLWIYVSAICGVTILTAILIQVWTSRRR